MDNEEERAEDTVADVEPEAHAGGNADDAADAASTESAPSAEGADPSTDEPAASPEEGEEATTSSADESAQDDAAPAEAEGEQHGPGAAAQASADAAQLDAALKGPGLGKAIEISPDELKGCLEALILVADKPIAPRKLAKIVKAEISEVREALRLLAEDYEGRGIVLDEVAGGFQFRTAPRFSAFVRSLVQQRPVRLSRAQLEVLAIVAYRQPVTRPELEDIRGVDSGSALKVLLERNCLKILGKRDEPGRPILYGTTTEFLELFGLKSLRDLPTLKEFSELSDESRDMFERRIGERPPLEGFDTDVQAQEVPLDAHEQAEAQQSVDVPDSDPEAPTAEA